MTEFLILLMGFLPLVIWNAFLTLCVMGMIRRIDALGAPSVDELEDQEKTQIK
jgi:hypothetical protein